MKRSGIVVLLHSLVRRPDPWTESMLITEHGTVYTIRDRAGCEREIQHPRSGKWERESRVTFSQLPMYEDYHREQYRAAKPYTPNSGWGLGGGPRSGSRKRPATREVEED